MTLLVQCFSGACVLPDFCLDVWSCFFIQMVQLVREPKHVVLFSGCSMHSLHLWFSFMKFPSVPGERPVWGHGWAVADCLGTGGRFCQGGADAWYLRKARLSGSPGTEQEPGLARKPLVCNLMQAMHWAAWSSSAITSYQLMGKSPVRLPGQFSDHPGLIYLTRPQFSGAWELPALIALNRGWQGLTLRGLCCIPLFS